MDDSESDNEGQLLIDESAGALRKKGIPRKPKAKKVTVKKKKSLKIVVKKDRDKSSASRRPVVGVTADAKPAESVNVRASGRIRKRTRRHSPSPVRTKKEPPKKKLKVKIKNVKKTVQKAAKPPVPEAQKVKDSTSVDVVGISDEELNNVQYSSVIVDEDPPVELKSKLKTKGIKLKLSLGKVLTSAPGETIDSVIKNDLSPSVDLDTSAMEKSEINDGPVIQPLIITKRQTSSTNEEKYDIAAQWSGNAVSGRENSSLNTTKDSSFYKLTSEEHKPLTLKLSVDRPKVATLSPAVDAEAKKETVFSNIRRSWSMMCPTQDRVHRRVTASENVTKSDNKLQNGDVKPAPAATPHLSTTPYFNAGLQSLLDVVSVEIKEQNKASSDGEKNSIVKTSVAADSLKQPLPLESHFLIRPASNLPATLDNSSNHQGHLPSLTFPNPKLTFSTKKRAKAKPAKFSPERTLLLPTVFESKDNDDADEPKELTDKERRRRDKKKVMNSDFIDPDTVVSGPDQRVKAEPAWKTPAPTPARHKLGGQSLLMPQMASNLSEKSDSLTGGTCRLPQKSVPTLHRKPKKGMATAKQRLANKLKLGKTYAC